MNTVHYFTKENSGEENAIFTAAAEESGADEDADAEYYENDAATNRNNTNAPYGDNLTVPNGFAFRPQLSDDTALLSMESGGRYLHSQRERENGMLSQRRAVDKQIFSITM